MLEIIIAFVLGLSVMFFGMATWFFARKVGKLSVVVAVLMALLGLQCLLSVGFIVDGPYLRDDSWRLLSSIDIVAVPFYALILRELVRPGSVSPAIVIANILPFVAISLAYIFSAAPLLYLLMIVGSAIYGVAYLVWTLVNIRRYNRLLMEQYSYTENVNLNWLSSILWFFFALLALWILDTVAVNGVMECIYLTTSVAMWMVIDYFLYKHENVIDELGTPDEDLPMDEPEDAPARAISELGAGIERLMDERQLFLDPNLKVSDVARAVNSNRTYVSAYFNREASTCFYDYVNARRVEHARRLLTSTDHPVKIIAGMSGYNSPQAFIRVFTKVVGISPADFRKKSTD